MTTKSSSCSISIYHATLTASIAALSATAVTWYYCRVKTERIRDKLNEQRMSERTGRIRSEIRLRTLLKEVEEREDNSNPQKKLSTGKPSDENVSLKLKCIGTVISPFTKRMGTPRQGAVAPHSRGYVQLIPSIVQMDTLSGVDLFSHVWIIFGFHANTDIPGSVKAKVRPPRAGGLKVGQMATRSPHRPNPIGLSLVRVVEIDQKKKRLHISALDLVNGTPVYDIKPVIPWDIPGYFDKVPLNVPLWVSQDDELCHVNFCTDAEKSLEEYIQLEKLSPFYTEFNNGVINAKQAIKEILAQDPRASQRRGKFDVSTDPYNIIFGKIQVEFVIMKERKVEIVKIGLVDLQGATYVDGVPLLMEEKIVNSEGSLTN